jgi:TolB-like protein/class 3 adenylate cyclase/Tfp pilus assembly protein PilF
MTGARRLAAILAADVVGYSRLMGEDEAGTAKIVRERREAATPIVRSFGGRLVKTMGDGVLLEFPSVVAAVECAIAIQKMMAERNATAPEAKRILYRVGVNLGDILIDGEDILGDGVNVAARLEGNCEPGAICLSEDAWRQARGRIEAEFIDLGEQSLKNIAHPVRAYALTPAAIAAVAPVTPTPTVAVPPPQKARALSPRFGALAAAVVVALLAAGGYAWRASVLPRLLGASVAEDKLKTAPRLSIVVLPFENLSGDPEQEYFADGITDDLTTDLSNIEGSFVIGRSTAAAYKGKPVDLKQLGRDLGVRYAVEGSVRRVGDKITINAQLVSTETGAHVWADRFEGEHSKLGELQVEAVGRIANALGVQLVNAEALRGLRERPTNPGAVDFAMRGIAAMNVGPLSRETVEKAVADFDQALRLDPDNPQALTYRATARLDLVGNYGVGGNPGAVWREAEEAADRALAGRPDNARAHWLKALVAGNRGSWRRATQFDAALTEFKAAVAADRNFASAYADMGNMLILSGRAEDALEPIEQALRLNPYDSGRYFWEYYMCDAYAHMAKWEHAAEWCEKSVGSNPGYLPPRFDLAAANGWLGRSAEAHAAVAEIQNLDPGFSVRRYSFEYPYRWMSGNETWKTEDQRIAEGLRKAGLPEG